MKDTSRRDLIKTLTATGGAVATGVLLSEHWVKPVINSVLLPAHAETTVAQDSAIVVPDGTWEGILDFPGLASNKSKTGTIDAFAQTVADILIQPAHACLAGNIKLKIMVIGNIATVSNSSQVGTSGINDGRISIQGHIDGQLSLLRALYESSRDRWSVNVEGLDNAFACNGNDAFGYFNRVNF